MIRADAEQRLAALRRDYEEGQGRLLQLEQPSITEIVCVPGI